MVEALLDRAQGAQPEQVHLDEAEVLDVVLVELHHHPSRHGGPLHRGDVDERRPGDEHPADVDAEMAGAALDALQQVEEVGPRQRAGDLSGVEPGGLHGVGGTAHEPGTDRLGETVDHRLGDVERRAHLAHRHPRPEGDDVRDHAGALRAVALVDVLDHLLAVLGGEVDVDVGRGLHLLVEEPLEKQVVIDGVDAGDA